MKPELRHALERRRPEIRARWEALLRLEKAPTALARPDTLVYLFDHTLAEVLSPEPGRGARPERVGERPECRSEGNPFRYYFAALEQSLLEALIWAQSEDPALTPTDKVASVGELCQQLRRVARREIGLFDRLCPAMPAEVPEV
ncbi:hypothetical protein Verru16b_00365 [Lacunisphaera limnophila]|uniref:RsbT co-antagonist protein RsbRD N-terminal domain-containing protein n=1 Tax=Lacunisphaera limnophila TaxID=1838286 RepID=A0A1I7PI64_9BACT|nr:hypothetical protein [Lacunisphaera limnophila]AOS43322.1 hypothetical protein Verru16b_00365 [Lacunisphaera limnophila]